MSNTNLFNELAKTLNQTATTASKALNHASDLNLRVNTILKVLRILYPDLQERVLNSDLLHEDEADCLALMLEEE